jgi:alkylation response protein AidB-like acyl-CoA dehydrogenase
MRFRYDVEHDDLRASVRGLLADVAGEDSVRRDMATTAGWDGGTWRRLCTELELPAMAVPAEHGGAGFGLVELGIVLGEAGRSLLCAPLLSTTVAAQALLQAGGEVAAAHLPGLAAGSTTGTLAAREPGGPWDAPPRTRAEPGTSGWRLTGLKDWVLDGHTAGLLVVTASTPAGVSLFLVDAAATGLRAEPVEAVDPTRRAATVALDSTPAVLLGDDGGAAGPLRRTLDLATVLLAAEEVGVAERCLETATGYAMQRHQFGRPIGSFQAVKHKLANVLVEVEAARAAALYAAWAADRAGEDSGDELAEVAAIAGVTCGEAALLAAGENVQVHGGIGMTWEHSAHLYLKRATTSRLLLGDPQSHLERLAALTGIGATRTDHTEEHGWQGWRARSPS